MANISSDYKVICHRCHRPAQRLESWLERRRLRTVSTAERGVAYSHRIVEHLVCPACYADVRDGRPAVMHNGYRIIGLAVAGALLVAASLPSVMPSVIAAFWRNGAAPSGWREHRTEGRSSFLQGRF